MRPSSLPQPSRSDEELIRAGGDGGGPNQAVSLRQDGANAPPPIEVDVRQMFMAMFQENSRLWSELRDLRNVTGLL